MNPQPWAYIDTMNNVDLERERIDQHFIFRKLLETVQGEMHETDGWFRIYFTTGVIIEYTYVFRPHRRAERKGESYFRYRDNYDAPPQFLDMDLYLDNYISMGPIYGALTMFVEHKLGLK